VAGVARDVLPLELVSGAADPSDSVLDVVVVGDLLRGIHCSYICYRNAWNDGKGGCDRVTFSGKIGVELCCTVGVCQNGCIG
jgi:hypothetical protein